MLAMISLNPFLFQVSYFMPDAYRITNHLHWQVLIPFCFRSLISSIDFETLERMDESLNPFLFQVSYFKRIFAPMVC